MVKVGIILEFEKIFPDENYEDFATSNIQKKYITMVSPGIFYTMEYKLG
jgi:hypothetical protein